MTQQIRMWEAADNTLTEIRRYEIGLERRLQDWLEADISMLDPNLLVIGREVLTAFGGKIDLLCLDSSGGLVIVELKKGRTPREVAAQVLDYAYWIRDLSYDEVSDVWNGYRNGASLSDAFEQKFGDELPETLNESHRSLIVAEEMDDSTERIVRYLSDLDVPINVATVQHFRTGCGSEILAQVYLIEPDVAADRAQKASRRSTYLTVRGTQDLADRRGVGELYRKFREKASGGLLTIPVAPAGNVALTARVEGGRTLTLLVVHLSESDEKSGLWFRLNATRLINYFQLTEEQIRETLPAEVADMPASEWRGARTDRAENWMGFKGYFDSVEKVDRFMRLLLPPAARHQPQVHEADQDE